MADEAVQMRHFVPAFETMLRRRPGQKMHTNEEVVVSHLHQKIH